MKGDGYVTLWKRVFLVFVTAVSMLCSGVGAVTVYADDDDSGLSAEAIVLLSPILVPVGTALVLVRQSRTKNKATDVRSYRIKLELTNTKDVPLGDETVVESSSTSIKQRVSYLKRANADKDSDMLISAVVGDADSKAAKSLKPALNFFVGVVNNFIGEDKNDKG